MPKAPQGELRETADGFAARITIKGKHRETFALAACGDHAEASERKALLADLAHRFRRAGIAGEPSAMKLLEGIAACAGGLVPSYLQVAGELVGSELRPKSAPDVPTFKVLADEWTDGRLHKRFPDHVKAKDSSVDEGRLKALCAIDVGGMTLGEVPIDKFRLDHAEAAMRALPKTAKRPGTRRHYAQLINRVLALAVYPCRYIAANPLPKGFMPKAGKPPAFAYLYPDEDAKLTASKGVPLAYRVLYAFLTREGCRTSEAMRLRFADLDLARGTVTLDENKTDDPRAWALDPGVVKALAAWKVSRVAKADDLVFVAPDGEAFEGWRLAGSLREHLAAAEVTRSELFAKSDNRRPIRAHDLRGTFVTLSLANGRTETWVADRTGHKSSQMINRYRRAARGAQELGLGTLAPMYDAIPELADCPAIAPNSVGSNSVDCPPKGKTSVGRQGFEPWTNGLKSGHPTARQSKTGFLMLLATPEATRKITTAHGWPRIWQRMIDL